MILFLEPTYTDLTGSNILFWQPTYTDLTVSSNGLMGFLMGRMVTAVMVFQAASSQQWWSWLPPFSLPCWPFRQILAIRTLAFGFLIVLVRRQAVAGNGCAASCVSTSLCAATCGAPRTKLRMAERQRGTSGVDEKKKMAAKTKWPPWATVYLTSIQIVMDALAKM